MSAATSIAETKTPAKPEITALPEVKITARERAWLASRMERGRRDRFTEVAIVTPGIASLILQQNLGNRPITRAKVAAHIDRLQRGDFILTHQGISIAKTTVLNDGQHRLLAITHTGISAPIQITFGAERAEFSVIDQGKQRTASDTLGILGESYKEMRAAVAKVLLVVRGVKGAHNHPDPQLVADYAMELRSKTMDEALAVGAQMARVTNPTSAAVGYYWIATHTTKPALIGKFWDGLPRGENLTGARLYLREWLRSDASAQSGSLHRSIWRAAVIVHAWNAEVSGKRKFSFAWNHTTKLPDVL